MASPATRDPRGLLRLLLELPPDELTAFIRYLEAAQGRSHEVTVGDAAGISDRIGEVRIATGTGHGLARMSGTGTGGSIPPEAHAAGRRAGPTPVRTQSAGRRTTTRSTG